jgi:hypothetical protein
MQVLCSNKNVKTCGSFLKILKENQLKVKSLRLDCVTLDKKILDLLLETFRGNQSIQKVSFLMDQWRALSLKQVLEVINNNERIIKVDIRDNNHNSDMSKLLREMRRLAGGEWEKRPMGNFKKYINEFYT